MKTRLMTSLVVVIGGSAGCTAFYAAAYGLIGVDI